MTLVLNPRQRLNGNRLIGIIVLLVFLNSCAVKRTKAPVISTTPTEKTSEGEPLKKEEIKKVVESRVNTAVLLLPFQLDRIKTEPTKADIKRSEVSLDFYQGFKMAIDNLAKKGYNFKLTVLDTKDNVFENTQLAIRPEVQSADLIIGPIFPKEIPAFAKAGKLTYSLQVSPLAASKPSQFNIPNLVSLVAPIDLHSQTLADYFGKELKAQDNLIIINKQDDDSFGFLNPLKKDLTSKGIYFSEVGDIDQIISKISSSGRNFVVVGSTNKLIVNNILSKLVEIQNELKAKIELFGHPNWLKASLDYSLLETLKAKITSSYYLNSNKFNIREFEVKYKQEFKVDATEYAYKGYDTGSFFGYLLGKYGANYPQYITSEEYEGLQTNYAFEKNPNWGYVNTYLHILQFDRYLFRPINQNKK